VLAYVLKIEQKFRLTKQSKKFPDFLLAVTTKNFDSTVADPGGRGSQ